MKRRTVFTGILLVLLSFSLGFVSDVSDNYFEISKNLDIFGKLYREINAIYVDETEPSKLMRTGIDAMLNSLDPYTTFIGEEQQEDIRFMSTGQYGGIGALVGKRKDKLVIIEPYEGYPADQAGLKAGDVIVRIGKETVLGTGKEVADVRELLRGDRGTQVALEYDRAGVRKEVKIFRNRIRINNVPYSGMIDDEIGYIALTGFTLDAGREVRKALRELKEKQELKGLVLDLRGNPGGRLDEAVNVSNVFLQQGEMIVETRGRIEGSKRKHNAENSPMDMETPLVVLVDKRSASASEIVAGSLQDLDRAVIVGQRSFGKGLVQNIRPLSYNTQLKVTTAKYYTPSGRCIQAINYAERREDGSVARIPDSLKNEFKTRNGRKVYDGGGIEPDIKVELENSILIVNALNRDGLIFEFATDYVRKNPQAPNVRAFELSDGIYQDFIKFAETSSFSFQTSSDIQLEKLEETVEAEAYGSALSSQMDLIEKELTRLKFEDIRKYKTSISELIRKEIVRQYYYEDGVLESSLDKDAELIEAAKVLKDPAAYKKILSLP
ncbi:MAG: S41 family peptidase [Bacteroidota bacterium]